MRFLFLLITALFGFAANAQYLDNYQPITNQIQKWQPTSISYDEESTLSNGVLTKSIGNLCPVSGGRSW